jgi:hypothetical protein
MSEQKQPGFGGWMGSMWAFTILRFGLFFALWLILYLVGLHGFLAPLVALVLSVPLSFVLLAGPRRRFTANLEARVQAHKVVRSDLDTQLDPNAERDDL